MITAPELEAGRPVLVEQLPAKVRAVIDSLEGSRLVLASADGRPFPDAFATGSDCHLVVPAERGVYDIPVTVGDRGDLTLVVDAADDAQLVQRRAYVRIEEPIDATCLLLDDGSNEFVPFGASVTDISGGGCAMDAMVIAPKDAIVVCSFAIPDERPVVTIGAVLPNEREDRQRLGDLGHKLRVMFTQITERDRDRLIRHILRAAVASGR